MIAAITTETWILLAGTLLGGGGLTAIVLALLNRHKTSAEAGSIRAEGRKIEIRGELQLVDSAIALNNQLREELAALRDDNEEMRQTVLALSKRVDDVTTENASLVGKLSRMQDEMDEMESKIEQQQREIVVLRDENTRLRRGESLTD